MWLDQNNFFRASIDEVDYMENQCVESPTRNGACDYQEYEDQDIGYADLQIPSKTKEEVQSFYNSKLNLKIFPPSICECRQAFDPILFDPTRRYFFDPKGKNWKIWHF